MSFEVGDRVRITRGFESSVYIDWAEEMDDTIGRTGTVRYVYANGLVEVTVDHDLGYWTYRPEVLELVPPTVKEER